MSIMNDDPREVLSLLNSLGFVGVTAQQLKAFMKDLKLYKKIKEREREQRKEEIKNKIICKQQNMIREVLREQKAEFCSDENIMYPNVSNFYDDDSLIKVRVRCISDEREDIENEQLNEEDTDTRNVLHMAKMKLDDEPKICRVAKCSKFSNNHRDSRCNCTMCVKSSNKSSEVLTSPSRTKNKVKREKMILPESKRPMSAPNLLEHNRELVGDSQPRSTSAKISLNSGSKSFIRPWRLQSEAQKSNLKKSDPVTLYQKYQQEWKQMSFPGEAKHATVRWAIREKMLGADPRPLPFAKQSINVQVLKKK